MRCAFLVLLGVANGAFRNCNLDKIKLAAHEILIKGALTDRADITAGWLATVAHIDRFLHVEFTTAPIAQFPADGNTAATCDRTWFCAAKDFELCPGKMLNTAEVREKPTFTWSAKPGEYYSLFLADLFSPIHATLGGFTSPRDIAAKINWGVINVPGSNDITQGTEINAWDRPKNPFFQSATFVYLLFAHGSPIDAAHLAQANTLRTANPIKVDLYQYIRHLGLTGRHLIGFNFFRAHASILTVTDATVAKQAGLCGELLRQHGATVDPTAAVDMCPHHDDATCTVCTASPSLPMPILPPTGSSPANMGAAMLAGKLRAQAANGGLGGALNGAFGRLFEEHNLATSLGGGVVVGAAVAAAVVAAVTLLRRRDNTYLIQEE